MLDAQRIKESFQALTPHAETLIDTFYATLFERYPAVAPLFSRTDMPAQKRKLLASLALVVKHCAEPAVLVEPLRQMGARHVAYGALPAHYDAVGECLLAAMAKTAGPLWNDELARAWTQAYQLVAGVMIEGSQAQAA